MSDAYNSYNTASAYTGDYIAKNPSNLGLTTNTQTSGIYTDTILGIGDKYKIDLYGSMMTWKTEDHPLLSILYNQGTESAKPPYIVWSDEYSGTSWEDISLDEMRLYDTAKSSGGTETLPMSGYGAVINTNDTPIPVTSASYVGGLYEFGDTAADATLALAATSYTNKNVSIKRAVTINGTATNCFSIAMKDGNNRGRVTSVFNKLRQVLYNLGYAESNGTGYTSMYFAPGITYNPVYFAFDDVSLYDGTSTVNKAEVLVRIEAVKFFTGTPELVLYLNAAQSNHSLGSYTHMLTYINRAFSVNKGTEQAPDLVYPFSDDISHPSRMVMIGQALNAVKPVPEGDNFKYAGNFTQGRERVENYSQIFVSPKYGITGTYQASDFRFGDDFARTRERWLTLYKGWKVGAYLQGVKAETRVQSTPGNRSEVNGQPVRSLGGLLDYALFPITYMKRVLPALSSFNASGAAQALSDWLSELANSLLAFRSNGAKNITLLCSQKFCDKLDKYVRSTFNDPWMGGTIQVQQPSQLTYGLQVFTYKTSKGIAVNFVHEPALDYMVEFPMAYHQFGTGSVDPKDILLSIDTANIKQVICRPDTIHGNIQDPGQDAFFEAMRGESSFKLRFPKNHAIIYCPES